MIPVSRKRLLVLYVVLAALLLGLGARAWFLQVVNHRAYVAQANLDRIRDIVEPTVRGEITDDVGAPLVSNSSALVISVNMALVGQQSDGGAAELRRLADAAAHQRQDAPRRSGCARPACPSRAGRARPYQPIPVAEHVSDRVGAPDDGGQARLPRRDRAGPAGDPLPPADAAPTRPRSSATCSPSPPQRGQQQRHLPVTGFSGVDLVGQAGLEQQYDKQLRGRAGPSRCSVNAAGQVTGHDQRITRPARRRPGDQPQLPAAAGRAERLAGASSRAEAEGNRERPGRRRGGDDHQGPGRRDGQLPDLQPGRVDRRHLRPGVPRAVRHRARRADPEPGHPGRVRARLDLEGDLDRGRHRGTGTRCTAATTARARSTSTATPSTTDFGNLRASMSLHQALVHVLRHGLLQVRLPDLAARQPQRERR